MKLATSTQIRAMDKETIDAFGVPMLILMENAALGVVEQIARRWSPLDGKRIAVVCGKGNNGGDGLAVARHLLARYDAKVTIWLTENPQHGGAGAFDINLQIARRFGIDVHPIEGSDSFESNLAGSDLIVDAVLGIGIEGDPRPIAARAIDAMNAAPRSVVSIDVPSGLNADTGAVGTPTVKADLTVTFAYSKPGLHLYPGVDYRGEIALADIGYPPSVRDGSGIDILLTDSQDVRPWLPSRGQNRDANKGRFGACLLIAGSMGFAGAASLCALGAVRSGAGLVTLCVPKSLIDIVMTRAPETAMTRAFAQTAGGSFSAEAIDALLAAGEKADAIGLGSGISIDAGTRELVVRFLKDCSSPVVIDADALNALALLSDRGSSLMRARQAPAIMTPHPGEMGRLLGCDASEVQNDRIGAVRAAVDQYRCVVLLKGARTLIAASDGKLAINETGNAGMASGGSGDLLTGVATTLMAQLRDPWRAAVAAAYIHGLAGDLATQDIGKAGLLATDVAGYLPAAIRQCGV